MAKQTPIGKVYLIDDRPGEEMTATAVTIEQIAALKKVCPYLREVTSTEFKELERRIERMNAGYTREEWL